jgi:amino-acid N-acetyltransferase
MVVPESQESIREATAEDIPGIVQIIEPLEQQGILVRRDRGQLEREIDRFIVIESEGNILGCAALYPFPEESCVELACLAVNPFYRDGGRGERLLAFAEARAKKAGFRTIFVLSTRTTHWFIERGYAEADLARLPGRKQALYNYDRRSKIFTKSL